MGTHPLNLMMRFFLELAALFAFGYWGWTQGSGWLGTVLAILLPVAAAVIWGVFTVPDDPSRSGNAPVPIPGIIRLLIELGIFALAGWAMLSGGLLWAGRTLLVLVFLHYLLSYDRIIWLLKGDQ